MTIREIIQRLEEEKRLLKDENIALKEKIRELTVEKRRLNAELKKKGVKEVKEEKPVVIEFTEPVTEERPLFVDEEPDGSEVIVETPKPQRRSRRKKVEPVENTEENV